MANGNGVIRNKFFAAPARKARAGRGRLLPINDPSCAAAPADQEAASTIVSPSAAIVAVRPQARAKSPV